MKTFGFIVLILGIALLAIHRLGRNSVKTDDLKKDVQTGQKVNEVLQKQRDNRIDSVDSADKLWSSHNED